MDGYDKELTVVQRRIICELFLKENWVNNDVLSHYPLVLDDHGMERLIIFQGNFWIYWGTVLQ